MSTTTPNLGLTLPTPNVDTGWGSTLNTDFTLLDNIFADNGSGTAVGINVGSGKTMTLGGSLILGTGDGTGTTAAPTIRGPARTGTNAAGSNLTIDASNGTGTGGSGKIILRTAPAGTAGVTANTMASVFEVNSAGGIGVSAANYGTAKQALLSGGPSAAANWGTVDGTVLTITSQAQGDILYRDTAAWARLAAGTNGQVLKTQGSGANPQWGDIVNLPAVQNIAAAGNSFTGIPSTARQITISMRGLTSANACLVRIGTSSGFATSGYLSSSSWLQAGTSSGNYSTSGFTVFSAGTAYPIHGSMILTHMGGNVWAASHSMGSSFSAGSAIVYMGGGTASLGGILDRIQLVPSSGSFTVTGTVSIAYI